jgi:hypothetical protein
MTLTHINGNSSAHALGRGTFAFISQVSSSSSVAPCANTPQCGSVLLAMGGNCKRLARQNIVMEAEAPTACDDVLVSLCGSCQAQSGAWERARRATLCVSSPLFGPSLSPTGLAWLGRYLDHYQALGLHHAFLYTRAMRDLKAASQVNSSTPVTWIDLTFPTSNLWYNGQTWAINDCINARRTKHSPGRSPWTSMRC